MVFVGEAVVEAGVREGLGGRSLLLIAIRLLQIVFSKKDQVMAEVGEVWSEVGRQEDRAGVGRER